ncbi:hypothetical protein [Streptomyces sp. HPF1205]|uniref:hypothetical protein n=1 Tax=Streptomyces sp. HPF1205 TaxID=2873262 RepID=UPI001CECC6EE|nr:hypothetical protein [Streptomyces sp. HPF1205]
MGEPCGACGRRLVLCLQCGAEPRCLLCAPYQRPSAEEEEEYELRRIVRSRPEVGLLGGVLAALLPAMFVWAGMTYVVAGAARTLSVLAGTVATGAYLAMGVAMGKAPLRGEIPACRMGDPTPYHRWERTGTLALLVQVAVICLGAASN